MPIQIGGHGYVGLGIETAVGTYAIPTKFIPIRSESLVLVEDKIYRTNVRGLADRSGAVQGPTHVEGDITFEVTSDFLIYMFYGGRFGITKTGAMAPFTYTIVPTHITKPSTGIGPSVNKTYSIYVLRADNPRGYLGCSISQLAFSLDNGMLMCTAGIMGIDEQTETSTASSFSGGGVPFPLSVNTLEVPTASPRADADSWTLTINDNLSPAFRLSGQRKPSYLVWGEREISGGFEVDYDALTDYNAFIAQTQQTLHWKSINNAASDSIDITANTQVFDSFQVNLGSIGDLQRAAVAYHAFYGSTDALTIVIKTNESIL